MDGIFVDHISVGEDHHEQETGGLDLHGPDLHGMGSPLDGILVGEIFMGQASTDELPKATASSPRMSTDRICMDLLGQLPFQEFQLHLQV